LVVATNWQKNCKPIQAPGQEIFMKKFLLGCAAVVLVAGTSLAADMPERAPVYKAAAPAPFSWTGFYGGVHGGYGWGDHESVAVSDIRLNPSGGFGGVQVGYNSMIAPNWLLGSEIQFSGGDLSDNLGVTRTKIDLFGTGLVRLGYTFDRTLIYVAGGAAWALNKTEDTGGNFRTNESHAGWAIGGGFEYAIDQRWSAKLEYLYADLSDIHVTSSGALNYDAALKLNTVKFGLNYRFGDTASTAQIPIKAVSSSLYSWSGSYVGGNVSYMWGDATVSDGPALSTSLHPRDWNAGVQTGYNWIFAPNLMFGIEADNSFLNVNGEGTGASVKVTNVGTVRGRLGYINDRTLIYGTGGLAYAKEKFSDTPNNQFVNTYQIGWTAGGGIEYMFAPRWSTKIEYLYSDFGHTNLDFINLGDASRSNLKLQSVSVGLNYKFDFGDLVRR
jgi:outer membrane immunogenic protein